MRLNMDDSFCDGDIPRLHETPALRQRQSAGCKRWVNRHSLHLGFATAGESLARSAALMHSNRMRRLLMPEPYDLQRFVDAQQSIYPQALAELRAGYKQSHWMWFVFPQIAGLGHSSMAQRYAIADLHEAQAYLQHPLLGPRLEECAQALLQHPDRTARQILGSPDDMKLRSSMTLFAK